MNQKFNLNKARWESCVIEDVNQDTSWCDWKYGVIPLSTLQTVFDENKAKGRDFNMKYGNLSKVKFFGLCIPISVQTLA